MNPLDIIVIIVVGALLALAVYKLISNKRKGRGCSNCGGDCPACNKR